MKDLFEKSRIGSIDLKNRFVRSATWEGMCKGDGTATEKLVKHYSDLTKGQVGLTVTGISCVNSMRKVANGHMGIDNDELIPSMKSLVENVHNLGGRIVVQLAYGGERHCLGRNMTTEEVTKVVGDFSDAARRTKKAGFDGIQIHGAHGFLTLSTSLHISTNGPTTMGGDRRHSSYSEQCDGSTRFFPAADPGPPLYLQRPKQIGIR